MNYGTLTIEEHKAQSRKYLKDAKRYLIESDLEKSAIALNWAYIHSTSSYARTKEEFDLGMSFKRVNLEGYLAAEKIEIPLLGVSNTDLIAITNEVKWYALGNFKPDRVLMSILLFKEYEWEQFDRELAQAKIDPSYNPRLKEFFKQPDKVDDSHLREQFYSLPHDVRLLLADYNAIGRTRIVKKKEQIESIKSSDHFNLMHEYGFYTEKEGIGYLEFPAGTASSYIQYEKKKLELLMYSMLSMVHREKNYTEAINRERDFPQTYRIYVDGSGQSPLCVKETFPLKNLSKEALPPHRLGCTCTATIGR